MFKKYFCFTTKLFVFMFSVSVFSQTVTYTPPNNYNLFSPLAYELLPTVTGGTISGGTYRQVSLFAGTGASGATNTSDPLTSSFGNVRGMVKDAKGDYYVAENGSGKIRKITASSEVSTVFSTADANYQNIKDLAINTTNGDIYFVVRNSLNLLINSNAQYYPAQSPTYTGGSIVVGNINSGSTDGIGTAASLNNPHGIAMAPDNSYLLIADLGNNKIRKYMLATGVVTTISGSSTGATNGALANATFTNPADIVIVNDNLMYVAEALNGNRIRKIDNGVVTTFAGGAFDNTSFDGTGTAAMLDQPHSLTVDAMGNLYVAERGNHKIRKITPAGAVSTLAGTLWNNIFSGATNENGNNARFKNPEGVYYDADKGFLLVSDTGNFQIRKIQIEGFTILPDLAAGMRFDTATGAIIPDPYPLEASLKTKYVQTFDSAALGTVNNTAVSINGNALVRGGTLILTSVINNQLGGITIPATGENSTLLKVGFNLITLRASGGADGLSYSFAPDANATTSSWAQAGTGTKLSISFADYGNRGIRLYYNPSTVNSLGTTVTSNLLAYSSNTSWISKVAKVQISVSQEGKLTLTVDGIIIFDAVQLPADYLSADKSTWKHVIKAITGGFNDMHAIDNLTIQQGYGPTDHTIIARNYNVEQTVNATINISNLHKVILNNISSIQTNQATIEGLVADDGTAQLQEIGVVWSSTKTDNGPTIADNKVVNDNTAIGNYSTLITGLNHSTTYYVKGYATNIYGSTSYSGGSFFTTAMLAPVISYNTNNTYVINTTITPLVPTNTGGPVSPAGVSTVAGRCRIQGSTNGPTTSALFAEPGFMAVNASGDLYVCDFVNNKIRKITADGMVSDFANVDQPRSIAVDTFGNVYCGGKPKTFGSPTTFYKYSPNGTIIATIGSSPDVALGLAIDASGNVYYNETYNRKVKKIAPDGTLSTIYDKSSSSGYGRLLGFTIDGSGSLYLSEVELDSDYEVIGAKVIKITASGVVSTVASRTLVNGKLSFKYFVNLVVDANGNLYGADVDSGTIKKIMPQGAVTIIAGQYGLSCTDGSLEAATMASPEGLCFNTSGDLFVSDSYSENIRKITFKNYAVSPNLPQGLTLNADGSITGTPTVLSPATDYTVTALNAGGSGSFTMSIAVTAPIPTWTGTEWINGTISNTSSAIIAGNYTSSNHLEIGELTIKNNASVVFQSGHNLTVNGKLTVETGSNLTLDSNANLLQTTNVANSGVISSKRNTAALKLLDYVLWSSPVKGQQLQSFSPSTLSNHFYTYNSGTNLYNAVTNPSVDVFVAGAGYLIQMPNDHPATPTIWSGTFTGIPNNGSINLAANNGAYNAIGNPYPSTLSADVFIDANGITDALYFWRKTNNTNNNTPSYATYTKAGGVGTANSADPNGLIPNGVIQVGQGFIAKATSNTISFTNAMRTATNSNQFLRTKNTDKSRIWLNLTNESGFFSQAMVAYMDGATSGIDATIDGRYFNDSPTALTSIINNEEFTIQGRSLPFDASDVVALGFKTETAGDFTLAIDHTDGLFAAGQKVFLKDNLTNTVNDLSTDNYKFTSDSGVFNNRFMLVYQKTLGTNDTEVLSNQVIIHKQNDKIRVDTGSIIMDGVKVYDLNGRLLLERKNINANQAVLSVVAAKEVLLIRIISNDGIVITKKLIN